jgi:hypothetical protein
VPNTVLYELFTTLQNEWTQGIKVESLALYFFNRRVRESDGVLCFISS